MGNDVTVRASLAGLLMKHRAGLHGYIFACVRHHDDARDILQQVALAISQWVGQLPTEEGFLPWAREIAQAKILAYRRTGTSVRPLDPLLVQRLAEAADRVEAMRPASDYQIALLSCLESLPVRSRLLLALRFDDAVRSVQALATRLRRTEQAVHVLLKRVKGMLRDCVERRVIGRPDEGFPASE